jgi:nucleosome binding factor SPN SPT16 subunit
MSVEEKEMPTLQELRDVWMRPPISVGRKVPGTLRACMNGFRYTTRCNTNLEINFTEIQYCFIQPAENEVVALIHFHLYDSIKLNKKEIKDLQFYTEVMDTVQDIDESCRYRRDSDELDEDQDERERRTRINDKFLTFTRQIQSKLWDENQILNRERRPLTWDMPCRKRAFNGVLHRSMCTLLPTKFCLVELTEMPFTVITLEKIEVINLERAALHTKNFDMIIVSKDFTEDVIRIEAIPIKSLSPIKEWLRSTCLQFYESACTLQWNEVLKAIIDNPKQFEVQGGWQFLNLEHSDSEHDELDISMFEPDSVVEATEHFVN